MDLTKYILFNLIILFSGIGSAQVVFKAEASKSEIGLNELVEVSFKMSEDNDSFSPPKFENFEIFSGPTTSIKNTFIEGERTYEKSITFRLKPKKTGTFVIESARFEVAGKIYRSNTINIDVVKSKKVDREALDALEKEVFLKVEYLEKPITQQDSVIVTYRLYVSADVGVTNWRKVNDGKISNATADDITPEMYKIENSEIEGKKFRSVIIKKLNLKPTKKGKIKISPMTMEVTANVPTGKKDIFSRNVLEDKIIELNSDKAVIEVD